MNNKNVQSSKLKVCFYDRIFKKNIMAYGVRFTQLAE